MATYIPYLKSRENKDKTHTILLKVTENRVVLKTVSVGVSVKKAEWNDDPAVRRVRKGHPQSTVINQYITDKINELKSAELKNNGKPVLAIFDKPQQTESSLFEYAIKHISYLNSIQKFGNADNYKGELTVLKAFKGGNIKFEDITKEWLREYQAYLLSTKNRRGEISSPNTLHKHFSKLRSLYNKAVEDEIFIPVGRYPFKNLKQNYGVGIKKKPSMFLTAQLLEKMVSFKIEKNTTLYHTRNIWLFQFFQGGMRIAEVLSLKPENIKGNVCNWISKGDKYNARQLEWQSLAILNNYQNANASDYIFPFLTNGLVGRDNHIDIKQQTVVINRHLKILGCHIRCPFPLTTHKARHTASRIIKESTGDIKITSQIMGHESIPMTEIYTANLSQDEVHGVLASAFKSIGIPS